PRRRRNRSTPGRSERGTGMRDTLDTPASRTAVPAALDLLVIGGGVSGLTVAHEAHRLQPSWNVTVLEAEERPRGTIRSERVGNCLCEWGPAGFLTNVPHTRDLSLEMGLEPRLRSAEAAAEHRYLWVRGALRALPMKPGAFLRSDLLTRRG